MAGPDENLYLGGCHGRAWPRQWQCSTELRLELAPVDGRGAELRIEA